LKLLEELQRRELHRLASPLLPEPENVDVLLLYPADSAAIDLANTAIIQAFGADRTQPAVAVTPISAPATAPAKEMEVGSRVRKGYDLVRIGNFAEEESLPLQDIAFFHHRLTVSTELTTDRIRLVRQCCAVLREIATKVFQFDPVFVTLFYEKGATSRFVRQKVYYMC
jgi:hypothetical protein